MTAKQWAARAVMAVSMATGLSACGGGGDSSTSTAAATATATPEILTAGLTVKESTFPSIQVDKYNMEIAPNDGGLNDNGIITAFATNFHKDPIGKFLVLIASMDPVTNTVIKAVIIQSYDSSDLNAAKILGCGFGEFKCTNITVNPKTLEVDVKSTTLKALDFNRTPTTDPYAFYWAKDTVVAPGNQYIVVSGMMTAP
jgi:hypothetical protein